MLDARNNENICMKIDFISKKREIVLFLSSIMAAMQILHERFAESFYHIAKNILARKG